jgi:hypothetical protein
MNDEKEDIISLCTKRPDSADMEKPKNKYIEAQDDIDFNNVDETLIDEEKAKFIYNEALANHAGIVDNINQITNKALSLLSFLIPVMTALVGYFIIKWSGLSKPLLFSSIAAGVFLVAAIVLLFVTVFPKGLSTGEGSPASYFTDDYYKRNMRGLYIGNIVNLHKSIQDDFKILNRRGSLLRIAIGACCLIPIIAIITFFAASAPN